MGYLKELCRFPRDMKIVGTRWCPNCDRISREWLYWPHETWCSHCSYPNPCDDPHIVKQINDRTPATPTKETEHG